jgi:hypothetical protein
MQIAFVIWTAFLFLSAGLSPHMVFLFRAVVYANHIPNLISIALLQACVLQTLARLPKTAPFRPLPLPMMVWSSLTVKLRT